MKEESHSLSHLHQLRLNFQPKLPKILQELNRLHALPMEDTPSNPNYFSEANKFFPSISELPFLKFDATNKVTHNKLKVGIVLSGGQASGGHNVISGLFDALKSLNNDSLVYGFLNGPSGIVENHSIEITESNLAPYRNQGGFDFLGSGRTKIETEEQFQLVEKTVKDLDLDGLVIVGGDDSNTNAAFLAEYFNKRNCKTRVIGVPKTIDGDLKNEFIEISFGFDTACKTYSELIGNVLRDALSQKKYYFFIKLMGRSASHISLECALQTHPNLTFIGEEIEAKKLTVKDITQSIADLICERSKQKKDYGVILIPEGIIEFIPECKTLIEELNRLPKPDPTLLSASSRECYNSLPKEVQGQLLLDRDPHGNVQVSKIESDRLFLETVKIELQKRVKESAYKGKFNAQPLFYGYEGRSCLPTNFDAQYTYALGYTAALLINQRLTGYMACVQKLANRVEEWQIGGIPLVSMMHMEERKGKLKPVVKKALVDLKGLPFALFGEQRDRWRLSDDYRYPGAIQYFGPSDVADTITFTLKAEDGTRCLASKL